MDQLFQALLQGGQTQDQDAEFEDLVDEEMTPQEFIRELNKYPIIRPKEFQDLKQQKKTHLENIAPQETISSANFSGSDGDFWSEFKSFLESQMSKDDAERVLNQFKEGHNKYINSLSLDSAERLAIHLSNLENNNNT